MPAAESINTRLRRLMCARTHVVNLGCVSALGGLTRTLRSRFMILSRRVRAVDAPTPSTIDPYVFVPTDARDD